MSVTYNFTRIRKAEEYVTGNYRLLDLVEADYEKISPFREESISFVELRAMEYLYNMKDLNEYGIAQSGKEFFFYSNPVVLAENMSKYIDNKLFLILFDPEPISKIVDIIVDSHNLIKDSHAPNGEVLSLERLRSMLDVAVKNGDHIEYFIDC